MEEGETMYVISTYEPCQHGNGWFATIRFWWFRRRFFFCTDCKEAIPRSKWRFEP